jgi:hypothetical protein
MAQVIGWSWQLLDAPAQRLMAALTLFAKMHRWPAWPVCWRKKPPPWPHAWTNWSSTRWRAWCKPKPADTAGGPRFSLVEPVREFVNAQLEPTRRAPCANACGIG